MQLFRMALSFIVMGLSLSDSAYACSCIFQGRFSEASIDDPLIVRATVIRYGKELPGNPNHYADMTIEVTDVVRGDYQSSELSLYGDTGMSCLSYVSQDKYPVGSEHLFALPNSDARQPLRNCAESSVLIRGTQVEGVDLNSTPQEYSTDLGGLLDEIRE